MISQHGVRLPKSSMKLARAVERVRRLGEPIEHAWISAISRGGGCTSGYVLAAHRELKHHAARDAWAYDKRGGDGAVHFDAGLDLEALR
jgi:hypothetical protein